MRALVWRADMDAGLGRPAGWCEARDARGGDVRLEQSGHAPVSCGIKMLLANATAPAKLRWRTSELIVTRKLERQGQMQPKAAPDPEDRLETMLKTALSEAADQPVSDEEVALADRLAKLLADRKAEGGTSGTEGDDPALRQEVRPRIPS